MASESKTVIYAALAGNAAIAVTKFAASFWTGSSAMLTEAIHSVVDTGNQVLMLLGMHRARKPPDDEFPLGHGKEVYFWSFIVAILIFAVGSGLSIYEGIKHLLHPEEVRDIRINYLVLAAAMVFEGAAWTIAYRGFRRHKGERGWYGAVHHGKDPTMFVVLFEDSAAMLGLAVAAGGLGLAQLTGEPRWDGAASIGIGLLLAAVAVWLAWETKSLLIGEAASQSVRERIRREVESDARILTVNELLTLQMGPEQILVNLSIDFRPDLTADEVESAVSELNRRIRELVPDALRVFIEAESLSAHQSQLPPDRRDPS